MNTAPDFPQVEITNRPRYTARVSRDGRWWMISVPEIDGLTQARRLSEVVTMARELIALTLDIGTEDIDIALSIDSIGDIDVQSRLDEIAREREEARDVERRLAEHTRALARDLASHDVPQRDIGAVLGVSHQRANQLLASV